MNHVRSNLAVVCMLYVAVVFAVLGVGFVAEGCKSMPPPEPSVVVTDTTKGTCLLLEAVTDDDGVERVCAKAEQIAPLVAPLIEALLAEEDVDAGDLDPGTRVAMRVTATKKVHRHHRKKKDGGSGAISDAGP